MASILIAAIAGAALYALLYRLRGGMFSNLMRALHASTGSPVALWFSQQRTQTMRAIWALPVAVGLWLSLGLPLWSIPALTVSAFLSMALIGNGDYLDTKRDQPFPDLVGLLRCSIAIAPVAYLDPISTAAYALAGIFHARIYTISHRTTGQSDLAEWLVGALTGFAIVLIRYV
jgi:hypothetical protein